MKKKKNIKKDAAFLGEKFAREQKEPVLPDALSGENIAALVSGKKQRANKRKIIRRAAAGVLAACLAVTSVAVYDFAVYKPVNLTANDSGMTYAKSYDELVGMVNDYRKKQLAGELGDSFRLLNRYKYAADTDIAVAPEEYGNVNSFVSAASEEAATEAAVQINNTVDAKAAYSSTNTRVSGIGEADRVITDGEYLYVYSGCSRIGILKPMPDGSLETQSVIGVRDLFDDAAEEITDFYVYGNKLLLNIEAYDYKDYSVRSGTVIYDITDKTAPVKTGSVLQDGRHVSSRLVNGSLIQISSYDFYEGTGVGAYKEENVIPAVQTDEEESYVPAENIAVVNTASPVSYVVVTKCDLEKPDANPQTLAIFGGGSEVYCTSETLYVTNVEYCGDNFTVWDGSAQTTVMAFDITGEKPEFRALGSFEGRILNTFSLDEYNGYLRVAATRGGDNAIVVMDKDMKTVSVLDGIGKGETIRSVRFMGDTAYVVTFVQTDPLFVIDLSDPASPVLKGELKLPGFSAYLHPAGEGYMIGIGSDGDENGLNGGAKISLFNVSDPASPVETDAIRLENSFFNTDYKAFVSVGDGSFLIPFVRYDSVVEDGADYSYEINKGSGAIRVSAADGHLSVVKEYMSSYQTCQRAAFIGNTVYTLDEQPVIVSFDMTTGEQLCMKDFYPDYVGKDEKIYAEEEVPETMPPQWNPAVTY